MTLRPEKTKKQKQFELSDKPVRTKPSVLHCGEKKKQTSPDGHVWTSSRVAVTRGWSGGIYTNIEGDSQRLAETYLSEHHDNSGRVRDEHGHLITLLNEAAEKALPGKGAVLKAGKSKNSSHFYIEFVGTMTEDGSSGANMKKARRLTKAVAEVASEFPYAIEPAIGDISGEGDYTTTLTVWRKDDW